MNERDQVTMHPNDAALHELAEGSLAGSERPDIEGHVASCEACRQTVAEIRDIIVVAQSLGPLEPSDAVWTRIQAAAHAAGAAAPPPVWSTRSSGWALALAATLLLATAASVTVGRLDVWRTPTAGPTARVDGADEVDPASVESELRQAAAHYEKAIKGLEQITSADPDSLDPATTATLQKNLTVIDQAISESRAALASQPGNEPAQQSLLDSFRTKLSLLQDTVALINEMRKGNETGAARIAAGLNNKS